MTQPKIEGTGHGIPRTLYASDGSNWYAVLVDSDGHVKIDVVSLPLPTDAATATNQSTMITALQLIDDLRNALGSVNTDDLQVDVKTYPGSNALGNIPFGYNNRYWERQYTLNAAAGTNFLAGTAVPAGEIWVVTNLRGVNANTNVSALTLQAYDGSTTIVLANKLSPGINVDVIWSGQAFLKAGDYVQARFDSCVAGDDLYLDIMGYKMKVS